MEENYKSLEQLIEESNFKRVQTPEGKWNLQNKKDGTFASEIWFDNLGTWSSYRRNEYNIFGWHGLVFLEKPREAEGVYPYVVKSMIYKYSSEGEFLGVAENTCGIWGYGFIENVKY